MALLDILKKSPFRKGTGKNRKADEKLKRPSKGALKRPVSSKDTESKVSVESEKGKETAESKSKVKHGESELAANAILSPHTTEKSAISAEGGAYVFRVAPNANKVMIKRAVEEFYGFKPKKVRITNMPSKSRINRGKVGTKSGFKKAVVYLKEGDEIEIT